MYFRRGRLRHEIELARHQHDGGDCHAKHAPHQIVVIVHRVRDFGRSRRQPSPLAIRDRRRCERRAMAPGIKRRSERFVPAIAVATSRPPNGRCRSGARKKK